MHYSINNTRDDLYGHHSTAVIDAIIMPCRILDIQLAKKKRFIDSKQRTINVSDRFEILYLYLFSKLLKTFKIRFHIKKKLLAQSV